ncbi:hypothetical protein [Streptomyces sp. NPDC050548]|uniref:hypothetical protein n=1 Tax=Streptomyces sp. NPDC050548 TaxID=3365629 RepID=UPI003793C675
MDLPDIMDFVLTARSGRTGGGAAGQGPGGSTSARATERPAADQRRSAAWSCSVTA